MNDLGSEQSQTQEELNALSSSPSEAGASCPAKRVGYRPLRKDQRVRPSGEGRLGPYRVLREESCEERNSYDWQIYSA
jgi:hypothetical protein